MRDDDLGVGCLIYGILLILAVAASFYFNMDAKDNACGYTPAVGCMDE